MDKNLAVSHRTAQSSIIQGRLREKFEGSRRTVDSEGEKKQVDRAKSWYLGVWKLNPPGPSLTQSNSEQEISGIAAVNQQNTQSGRGQEKIRFPSVFMYLVLYQNATGGGGLQYDRRLQIANANQCREHLHECVCEQLNRGVSDEGRY